MAILESDIFSFTWQIKNFSMCPHRFTECIFSPTFVANGTKWALCMFPRGRTDRNYVSSGLKRINFGDKGQAVVAVSFDLTVHSVHPDKDVHFKAGKCIFEFQSDNPWGCAKLCLREDIFNAMNGFLPNDTLTIECRIWKTIDGDGTVPKSLSPVSGDLNVAFSDSSLQKEMLTTAARNHLLDLQTQLASTHYLARTFVRVGRKCIIWPIERVCALRPHQRLSIPVVTAGISAPSFAMTLYLSGESVDDQSVQIEIRIEESAITKVCFVRCRITTVNSMMKAQHVAEDDHFFEPTKKNDVWMFPTFIQITNLRKEKYLDSRQGTLNLRCEFVFSTKEDEFHIEDIFTVPALGQFPKPVRREFNDVQISKQVYEEQKFSDVALRTGGRSFKAHKNILSARSPVFRTMLETDMRENESGVVDITDSDPDTVEQLLVFIYTDNVEDLPLEKAMKLYSVADKYEVLSLKWHCSNLLKSALAMSNVCEVLILADLHQDGDLLDHVKNYIHLNTNVILNSEMWEDLMKSNAPLAARVMRDLLTGKMGHL